MRAALALIAMVVLAGCSRSAGGPAATQEPTPRPTPTAVPKAWPQEWEDAICLGLGQMTDAGNHIGEVSEAAKTFDVDVLADEANKAGQDAREAADWAEGASDWAPGAGVKKWLIRAATSLRKGANLASLGADTLDAGTLDEANAAILASNDDITQLTAEITKLRSETGFTCP